MYQLRWCVCLMILLASMSGSHSTPAAEPATARAGSLRPVPAGASRQLTGQGDPSPRLERLPPVQRVNYVEAAPTPHPVAARAVPAQSDALPRQVEEVPGVPVDEPNSMLIDLPTALRLADANNLLVAAARMRVSVATARAEAANALWLPSIRGGTNYNRHEGAIQDVRGLQFNTSRGAFYAGAGAGIYGAGTPLVPGLYANFHLTDALFQPLAARQLASSINQAAIAETNDTLLQVALGYFELLRAGEDLAIALATRSDAQKLVDITTAYAESGAGLQSDANRARTELSLRLVDTERSREAKLVASARLAQLLRLNPSSVLSPADAVVVPIDMTPPEVPLGELVAEGLSRRPELAENRLLVAEAVTRLRREQWSVFLPSVLLGASYGGMGAGINEQLAPFHDRLDVDAVAYWEMRNLGFGDRAARREARASVSTNNFRYLAVMDQVAREVVESHTQVQFRKKQIGIARQGIDAAVKSHTQNLERIEEGKGLPIELLQSIQALAQARRDYLRTLIEYNTAQFTLYRSIGWPTRFGAL